MAPQAPTDCHIEQFGHLKQNLMELVHESEKLNHLANPRRFGLPADQEQSSQ